MDALTPSTAAQAGLSRSALYRGARAGRLDRIARGIYLPAQASAADWDLTRGRDPPPGCHDLPDLRARPLRPDRRNPRRAGRRDPTGVEDTREHGCDRMASIRPGHIRDGARRRSRSRDRIRRSGSTRLSGRSPTRSGSVAGSDTNWRATRCANGSAAVANRPG